MKIVVVLTILIFSLFTQPENKSFSWTTPEEISSPTVSNWFPSVTIDPSGDTHLFWSSGKGAGENAKDLLMYSVKHNGEWSSANDVIQMGLGGWVTRNSIATDRSGTIHMVVRSRDAIYYTSALSSEAWSARNWRPLHRVSGLGQPYYSAITISPNGILHIVWQELSSTNGEQGCQGCSDVWYRRSQDNGNTWSAPVNLSNGTYGSIKPQITIDLTGNLYVSWDEGKDPNSPLGEPKGIAYTRSQDQGITWEAPQRMSIQDNPLEQATLAIDGQRHIVLLCRGANKDDIFFRVSTDQGQSWSEFTPLPYLIARDRNETPWDKYSMATDSLGNIHLLAVARRNTDQSLPALYHVVWNSATQQWQEPETIFSRDLYPEWPQLTIAQGNQLHATWFTRRPEELHPIGDAITHHQVWYSMRTVDAPASPVEILPTPTAEPTATLPAIEPTATPSIALYPNMLDAPQPVPVQSETPLMRNLGMALAPPLVILMGVVLLVVARRIR